MPGLAPRRRGSPSARSPSARRCSPTMDGAAIHAGTTPDAALVPNLERQLVALVAHGLSPEVRRDGPGHHPVRAHQHRDDKALVSARRSRSTMSRSPYVDAASARMRSNSRSSTTNLASAIDRGSTVRHLVSCTVRCGRPRVCPGRSIRPVTPEILFTISVMPSGVSIICATTQHHDRHSVRAEGSARY